MLGCPLGVEKRNGVSEERRSTWRGGGEKEKDIPTHCELQYGAFYGRVNASAPLTKQKEGWGGVPSPKVSPFNEGSSPLEGEKRAHPKKWGENSSRVWGGRDYCVDLCEAKLLLWGRTATSKGSGTSSSRKNSGVGRTASSRAGLKKRMAHLTLRRPFIG